MDHHSWTTLEWETAYKAVESLRKGPGTTQGISSATEAHTARQRVFDALEVGGPVKVNGVLGDLTGTITSLHPSHGWMRVRDNYPAFRFEVNDIYVGWLSEGEN